MLKTAVCSPVLQWLWLCSIKRGGMWKQPKTTPSCSPVTHTTLWSVVLFTKNNYNSCSCLNAPLPPPPSWKTQDETPWACEGEMQNLSNFAGEKAALWFCRTTWHQHLSIEIQLQAPESCENMHATFSYSQEYKGILRHCDVLPSSLHRMFATAESAAAQWKGQGGGKRVREKHEFTLGKQGQIFRGTEEGDFSCAMSKQNVSDSYKMFLTAVDRTIFLPKSKVLGGNMTCLERCHRLFCFISTGPLSSFEIVNVKMP